MIDAHPLQWPFGYKRSKSRKSSAFKQTAENAQKFLRNELYLMGATNIVVSSNIPVRKDGWMYGDMANEKISDPGVAIYFKHKGIDIVMCCDTYFRVWENVYALGKGIEALRGMERWGVSEFMERAFTGFKALPEAREQQWFEILGVPPASPADIIKEAYRKLVQIHHPDKGGTVDGFTRIKNAYLQGLESLT